MGRRKSTWKRALLAPVMVSSKCAGGHCCLTQFPEKHPFKVVAMCGSADEDHLWFMLDGTVPCFVHALCAFLKVSGAVGRMHWTSIMAFTFP
jgi:hypothetical protein